ALRRGRDDVDAYEHLASPGWHEGVARPEDDAEAGGRQQSGAARPSEPPALGQDEPDRRAPRLVRVPEDHRGGDVVRVAIFQAVGGHDGRAVRAMLWKDHRPVAGDKRPLTPAQEDEEQGHGGTELHDSIVRMHVRIPTPGAELTRTYIVAPRA